MDNNKIIRILTSDNKVSLRKTVVTICLILYFTSYLLISNCSKNSKSQDLSMKKLMKRKTILLWNIQLERYFDLIGEGNKASGVDILQKKSP